MIRTFSKGLIYLWKDIYRIGEHTIDEQHKELFQRTSDFLFLLRYEGDCENKLEKVKETLGFLQGYVRVHFETEEAYQKEINFPDILTHQEAHEWFRHEIGLFVELFNSDDYNEDQAQKLAKVLLSWLIKHVVVEDRKIGVFAKNS
jgi:hemerythrin